MQSLKRHTPAAARRVGGGTAIATSDAARMRQLIDAAEYIFLAKGYHTATMNDVAKAAGISKKTIYKLIESKAALFIALLEYHQEKLRFPAPREDWTLTEILVQNLLSLGKFLLSAEQTAIIRLIMAEYTHCDDFGPIFHHKRVLKAKALLENSLRRVAPSTCVTAADAREMASMLFGMALGEFHAGVLIGFRPIPSEAALTRRIRRAVDLFLAGCGASLNRQTV